TFDPIARILRNFFLEVCIRLSYKAQVSNLVCADTLTKINRLVTYVGDVPRIRNVLHIKSLRTDRSATIANCHGNLTLFRNDSHASRLLTLDNLCACPCTESRVVRGAKSRNFDKNGVTTVHIER